MRIILSILGGLVGLVVIMAVIGAFLPRSHVTARQAAFKQPPAAVFAVISDFAAFPAWRTGVKAVEVLPARAGHVFFREQAGYHPVAYEVLEAVTDKKLVLKIANDNLPYGGTWTYVITPAPQGAILTITENGEVKNVLFRFLGKFVIGQTTTIDIFLRDLGRKFEENASPQPAA